MPNPLAQIERAIRQPNHVIDRLISRMFNKDVGIELDPYGWREMDIGKSRYPTVQKKWVHTCDHPLVRFPTSSTNMFMLSVYFSVHLLRLSV